MTAAPSGELEGAVELLERSLGYTRVALADVRPGHLRRPTPCAGWSLARLMAHMEDALDAFTEAASGYVAVSPPPPTASRVEALREKACALLGAWASARSVEVAVEDLDLDARLLVGTAALEITVHGWDVAQATGSRTAIPEALATCLLPVAREVVAPTDRVRRFARPLPVAADAAADARLLAYLGRDPDGEWCPSIVTVAHVKSDSEDGGHQSGRSFDTRFRPRTQG